MRIILLSGVVLAAILVQPARSDVIYDSKGFEAFDMGFLTDEGQDGWVPVYGVFPLIWPGPPSQGAKSIKLRVYMADGDGYSGIARFGPDLIAAGYTTVTVSFEVYRPTPQMGWFPVLRWGSESEWVNPSSGGQWPEEAPFTSRTYPLVPKNKPFEDEPSAETVVDRWVALQLTWDFAQGVAYGWYDGVLVTAKQIEGVDSFDAGFWIVGSQYGGAPDLHYLEDIWIDNFIITGEKAGCYADCDASGSLDLFDFLCFVNLFNAADPGADCDAGGGLDLFDFLCFVNAFNGGC